MRKAEFLAVGEARKANSDLLHACTYDGSEFFSEGIFFDCIHDPCWGDD